MPNHLGKDAWYQDKCCSALMPESSGNKMVALSCAGSVHKYLEMHALNLDMYV